MEATEIVIDILGIMLPFAVFAAAFEVFILEEVRLKLPKRKSLMNWVKNRLKKDNIKSDIEEFYTGLLSPKGDFVQCDYFDAEKLCKEIATKYTDEMICIEDAQLLIIKKGYIWIREVSIEYKRKKISKKQYKWFKENMYLLNDEQKVDARNIVFLYKDRK